MHRSTFSKIFLIFTLTLLIPFAGCSTTKSMYQSAKEKVIPRKAKLKKKVLVMPFLDQAGMGEKRVQDMTETLLGMLEKDKHLLINRSNEPVPSSLRMRSPRFGIVIDPDLAKRAEELGMNVVMTVVLPPFEVHSKVWGIWPFRKVKRDLEVSVVVNALDIVNGTLFLTHLESKKVRMQDPLWEDEDEKLELKEEELFEEVDRKKFEKALSKILKDQASAIRKGLALQPWSGRVLSTDGKTLIISAGKDIGIQQGNVFEVFGRGESIRSSSGRPFYLMGEKVGEIETVSVKDKYSSAIPLNGDQFKAGQIVKLRH